MDIKEYRRKYYQEHKEEIKKKNSAYHKKWYSENKKYKELKNKEWLENNKEKRQLYVKEYERINHDRILKRKLERRKKRKETDKLYKLKEQSRDVIKKSFRGVLKGKRGKTTKILGCDLDFFVNYLLSTFKNNYGYDWDGKESVHIDHIIPLSIANSKEDVIKLCNYKNLQLLKARDNLKKGNKLGWSLHYDI